MLQNISQIVQLPKFPDDRATFLCLKVPKNFLLTYKEFTGFMMFRMVKNRGDLVCWVKM